MLKQTRPEWNAIIVFDGIAPTIQTDDARIRIIQSPKSEMSGAGHVRNYGINHATTEWVAFVDDDDAITQDYVERFLEETQNNNCDLIIFRMTTIHHNEHYIYLTLMPSPYAEDFKKNDVGISFAVKKTIFDSGIVFESVDCEDYVFLEKVRQNNNTIIISPYVLYLIRYYSEVDKLILADTRVFINFPVCVQNLK
jgi:glycosyltransferase involved in cell wall biosynthesis